MYYIYANNKGTDRSARMRRLVSHTRRQVFSRRGPLIYRQPATAQLRLMTSNKRRIDVGTTFFHGYVPAGGEGGGAANKR